MKKIRGSEYKVVIIPTRLQFSLLLALSLLLKPVPLCAGEPLELLKSAVERVIAVLEDPRLKAAEQEEFIKLFRTFLEKIYSDRIDLYEGERVVVAREIVDQEYAEVESKLIDLKNAESRLRYRLKRSDGKWKVYDAVVADISIVNNYRSQFDRVISKSSFEELTKMLREKAG